MTGKALAAAAAAAVALLAAASAQPLAHAPAKGGLPLLGFIPDRGRTLVRVDPLRLRALPGKRLHVGNAGGWAFSPDRRLLALEVWGQPDPENFNRTKGFVRLVDPSGPAWLGDISVGQGPLFEMDWLAPDRIVALAYDCCSGDVDLVLVDPAARRLVERRSLRVDPIRTLRAGNRLVVLAAPEEGIAPVSLLLIDAGGQAQSVVVSRIEGGHERIGEGQDIGVDYLQPALTLAPDGKRAFVFSPAGLAAEIDLSSLTVGYHPLLRGRRATAARAKRYTGASAWAETLPDGLVALTGSSSRPYVDKNGNEQLRRDPAGLQLVDTRTWSVRLIDAGADSFAFASDRLLTRDVLLATGSPWDSAQVGDAAVNGLRAYALDGSQIFHRFKHLPVGVAFVYQNRAFVSDFDSDVLRVVNLGSGRVVGRRAYTTIPWLVTP